MSWSDWYRRKLGWIPRPVRQTIVAVIGGTVLLLGLVMIVTPGPALIVVPLGLAILALEFAWAARWLHKIKQAADGVHHRIKNGMRSWNSQKRT